MATTADHTIALLFRQIIEDGPTSRADLMDNSGLGRASVSTAAAELLRRGLVEESETQSEGGRGRPVSLLDVDNTNFAVAGLELGSDRIRAGLYSMRGRQILRVDRPSTEDGTSVRGQLRHASAALHDLLDEAKASGVCLLGVGVSFSGLVDARIGTVKFAPTLGMRDQRLREAVFDALNGGTDLVCLDTSANFAVLAERRFRSRLGAPLRDLVYLSGTYGITAGTIANGTLLHGTRGMAGEVGHFVLDGGDQPCACGRTGCFESQASLDSITRNALQALGAANSKRRRRENLTAKIEEVAALSSSGNTAVLESLRESARWLGMGAATVASIFDPEVVVLGGHYAHLAPWLLEPALKAYTSGLLSQDQSPPRLEVSALDSWAPTVGAALAVIDSIAAGGRPLPHI